MSDRRGSLTAALLAAAIAMPASIGAHQARMETPAGPDFADARTARTAAIDFFLWYGRLLAADRQAADDPTGYAHRVAVRLRRSIARRLTGIDGDYFLKSQDYFDSWLDHVAATPAERVANGYRTQVTLGTGPEAWRLTVRLVREDGLWKVAWVTGG